jgi:hypothetical protein
MFKELVAISCLLGAAPASAAVTYYVGNGAEAAFNTAAGVITYVNFSGNAGSLPATSFVETNTGIVISGFSDSNAPENLALNGTALVKPLSTPAAANSYTRIGLAGQSIVAVAFRLSLFNGAANTYCIEAAGSLNCAGFSPLLLTSSGTEFVGIIADGGDVLPSIDIRQDGALSRRLSIAEFGVIATSGSAVPEPSSIFLGAIGLLGIWTLKRRSATH